MCVCMCVRMGMQRKLGQAGTGEATVRDQMAANGQKWRKNMADRKTSFSLIVGGHNAKQVDG